MSRSTTRPCGALLATLLAASRAVGGTPDTANLATPASVTAPSAAQAGERGVPANAAATAADTAESNANDGDDDYDTNDEITVADMMSSTIPADELVDDDDGANEAAEVDALTPTDEEAAAIADAYVKAGLAAIGADGEVPLTVEDALLRLPPAAVDKATASRSDPADRSVLDDDATPTSPAAASDPDTDLSRLREALPLAVEATAPTEPAPQTAIDPKHSVVRLDPVTTLQTALAGQGLAVKVDGYFGNKTRTALKAFQKQAGLKASGELDARTAARLGIKL